MMLVTPFVTAKLPTYSIVLYDRIAFIILTTEVHSSNQSMAIFTAFLNDETKNN